MSEDALSKVFGVDKAPVEVVNDAGTSVTIPPEGNEDEDHSYARARHYELAEKGAEALGIAMRIVRESENPQAIKELAGLIKTLSDVNKNLLLLNKDKADVKGARGKSSAQTSQNQIGTAVQNQTNIVFSGTSQDLDDIIAKRLENK